MSEWAYLTRHEQAYLRCHEKAYFMRERNLICGRFIRRRRDEVHFVTTTPPLKRRRRDEVHFVRVLLKQTSVPDV